MGFNKREHLQKNIEALRILFTLQLENRRASGSERLLLTQYSGFGGLKFVLNPNDIDRWSKSDQDFFPMMHDFYSLLSENSKDDKQFKQYLESVRNSVLTAFYTPPKIVQTIADALKERGITIDKLLEPSAGAGVFIDAFKSEHTKVTAYEKEILTGNILQQLHPDSRIKVAGFEEIPEHENGQYDIIASNIPFGDTSVFDLSYSRSSEEVKRQAARSIHSYFFLKGIDTLREGGILLFITSQGVLNSPKNELIRNALMENCSLVSAIRLPNNLFTDHAGTEVGSDLIVLQKNSGKQILTNAEQNFCLSLPTEHNTSGNSMFKDSQRIIHTSQVLGTDPYGKPALNYFHNGGITGISDDLKKMLSEDFKINLDIGLYMGKSGQDLLAKADNSAGTTPLIIENKKNDITVSSPAVIKTEVQLSLFDLFENDVQRVEVSSKVKSTVQKKKNI